MPGLYKIFDEILVNAADNKQRDDAAAGIKMTKLEVSFDGAAGCIRVSNDGAGISCARHDTEPMHIPQLIFGELLTSSNYDDSVKQTVGGRNGFGAKLANIFSKRFLVEIENALEKKKYKQEWRNNMSVVEKPSISAYAGSKNSTSITFWPDLQLFGLVKLEEDFMGLLRRRVFDIAGTTPASLKVILNSVVLNSLEPNPVRSFKDYPALYLQPDPLLQPRVFGSVGNQVRGWEVCISLNDTESFTQVSFVNNIATTRGGTHVNYVQELVVKAVLDLIATKKGVSKSAKELTATEIKRHLFLFLNTLIVNPTFDSQTKTNLTTKKADLELSVHPESKKLIKAKLELSEDLLKDLKKSGLIEAIIERATEKAAKKLDKSNKSSKMQKRLTGIPKLEDANDAGTKNGYLCTLILTEGDSAKALAVSGLSIIGRDRYGVFPLKGKLLNVREASINQLHENTEIKALKSILGLEARTKHPDLKTLRYGRVMIMADQDHDGSHIKGLVINLFHSCWPGLQQMPGFLKEFITPIVKVSKGISASGLSLGKGAAREECFYSIPDFEAWKSTHSDGKGWTTKYYKGLGTSTATEAKAYFSDLERHMIDFEYDGPKVRGERERRDSAGQRTREECKREAKWLSAYCAHTGAWFFACASLLFLSVCVG